MRRAGYSLRRHEARAASAGEERPPHGHLIDHNLHDGRSGSAWLEDLTVHYNLVQATAGAVEREGPLDSTTGERSVFLCSLPDAETAGLGWLGDDLRNTRPEVRLDHDFEWRRTLLDSTDLDAHYTLEDGRLQRRAQGWRVPAPTFDCVPGPVR